MKFIPDYELRLLNEENFEEQMLQLEQKLDSVKNIGSFNAFDNTEIYYEYFLCEDSRANVVFVHGLSEFSEKYHEQIYYFLNQGYNVYIFDLRCHGLSARLTDELDLLHVDKSSDYVKDLSQFIDTVVLPTDKPIYLFSHSLGGAISAFYLANNGDKIKKAVLCAPCFDPIVKQVPKPVAWMFVKTNQILRGKKAKFKFSSEFNPEVEYNQNHGSSKVRFEFHLKMRRENRRYQTTPMSYGWIDAAFSLKSRIVNRKFVKKLSTPILLFSAQNDKTVCNKAQSQFAKIYDKCEFLELEGINHSIFASDNDTLEFILKKVFDYLD